MDNERVILAYDGVCNLCNALVRFVIKHDKKAKVSFIALQSDSFERYFPNVDPDLTSVLLRKKDKIYNRSSAILQLFKTLGGGWSLFLVFYIIPRFIRDAVYRFIAKVRYRFWGRSDSCRIPDEKAANRYPD